MQPKAIALAPALAEPALSFVAELDTRLAAYEETHKYPRPEIEYDADHPLAGGYTDLGGGFEDQPRAELEGPHLAELFAYVSSQEVASEVEALAQTLHDRVSNGKKPAKRLAALLASYGAVFKVEGQQRPGRLALAILVHRRQKGLNAILQQPA